MGITRPSPGRGVPQAERNGGTGIRNFEGTAGMRGFGLRGLWKVRNEFGLAEIGFNLTRLFNLGVAL